MGKWRLMAGWPRSVGIEPAHPMFAGMVKLPSEQQPRPSAFARPSGRTARSGAAPRPNRLRSCRAGAKGEGFAEAWKDEQHEFCLQGQLHGREHPFSGEVAEVRTMHAAVLDAPGQVRLAAVAVPQPGPSQVRVRLEGCGVCASNLTPWAGPEWMRSP